MHRRFFLLTAVGMYMTSGFGIAQAGLGASSPIEMQGVGDAAQLPSRPRRRRRWSRRPYWRRRYWYRPHHRRYWGSPYYRRPYWGRRPYWRRRMIYGW
jgi:hypothetical protein